MRGVSKTIILGTLGQDPEVRYSQSGTAVANLSVATNYRAKNGDQETEWHRIVLFGKTAEIAEQYLRKGSQAYFEGRNKTRKWQDQNGQDRWTTEVICFEMQMLGRKEESDQQPAQTQPRDYAEATGGSTDGFDDIPF